MKKNYFIKIVLLLVATINLNAQAPIVEWRNYSWIDHEYQSSTYVDQRHSDYDWWYDHCTGYTDPINKTGHVGYMAVGVGKFRCAERSNPSAPPLLYDEQNPVYGIYADGCTIAQAPLFKPSSCDYDYGNFENHITGALGLGFNQIGKINPDGTTAFVIPMNYDGEWLRVKQLQNGTYFTVGSTLATRKRLASPQNGKPLYYNRTTTNPNDYFKYNEIFDVNNPQKNVGHWNIMKFDDDGNCLMTNIYGLNDFNDPSTFNYTIDGNPYSHNGKQLAYFMGGQLVDFVQEPNENIAMVGFYGDYTDNGTIKAAIMKIDVNGNVLGKRYINSGISGKMSVARAIEFATIGGQDYYIIAVTQEVSSTTQVEIYAMPTSLSGNPILLHTFTPTASNNDDRTATVWAMSVKNNFLYIPLITDCNWVWWAGDRYGKLNIVKLNLNDFNPSTNVLANNYLRQIHAFDLKARITALSDGNFALVGAVQNQPWSSLGCATPPNYIMYPDVSCPNNWGQSTDWWNTDTYVAKVDDNAVKLWDTSFDVDTPFDCNDYPTDENSGGGDPKRQECMYGVSEAPDGGIVVSGNNSSNVDDNYMAKLYPDCSTLQTYDINAPITNINGTVTWNSSKKVKGIIRINNGSTLNVTGANTIIEFADTKQCAVPTRIEIYGNGKLNVNGATLTSIIDCPTSMWEGVQVFGNGNSSPQNTSMQPYVTLTNAMISNAHLGIENGKNIAPAGPVPYSSGGVVQATNSTFLNNRIDVYFLDYAAPLVGGNEPDNKSKFTKCTFKANNYLNDPSYVGVNILGTGGRLITETHVVLNGVKGVTFIGNTFKTDLTYLGGSLETNKLSTGIRSNNANFKVYSTCLAIDQYGNCTGYDTPNTFEDLRYGVYAQSSNPLKNFSITTASFKNCYASIYQSGINYSTVNKNSFLVDKLLLPVGGKPCALNPVTCSNYFYYVTNSTAFKHEENNYEVATGINQNVNATIFNNCGTGTNESYRNVYTNCYAGHQVQLTNGVNTTTENGLQIKCNRNTYTRHYDIAQTSGIIGGQGYCDPADAKSPANNTFTHLQAVPPSDINAYSSGGFNYRFITNPVVGLQDPIYITANIVKNGCSNPPFVFNNNTCPSHLTSTGGGNPSQLSVWQTNALNSRQTADQLSTALNQALAQGADQSLITAINGNMSNGNLKNLLMSKSPYLSDEVLIAFLQKTNAPPPGHIKEVIVANSPVSGNVKTVLDNTDLPNGIRNQINSAQVGTHVALQKKQEIAHYTVKKDLAVNDIVRYYLEDTVTANTEQKVREWLEWNNAISDKYNLVFALIEKGLYNRAKALSDSVYGITKELSTYNFLVQYSALKQQGKTWEELRKNPEIKQVVEKLAYDSLAHFSGNALAVLDEVYGNVPNYEVVEALPDNVGSRLMNNEQEAKTSIYDNEVLNVSAYPNPFNNSISLNYELSSAESNVNVEIRLIELATGRVISKKISNKITDTVTFDTENIADGVYIINLSSNGRNISNTKVINIK